MSLCHAANGQLQGVADTCALVDADLNHNLSTRGIGGTDQTLMVDDVYDRTIGGNAVNVDRG